MSLVTKNIKENIWGSHIFICSIFCNKNNEIVRCEDFAYGLSKPFTISSKELIYYIQNEIRNQYPYKYKFMESYMFDFNCNIKEVCYAKEENLINFTSVTPYNDIHFDYNPSILSKYNTIFLLFVEQ
tara:strand:- start:26 stop:406 length:381 start_codon:yes stop_codon:yes gene_type:complete